MITKRGRPNKKVVEKKSHVILFRVTPLEYGLLKNAAKAKNIPVTKLIREYLSEFLDI